MSSGLGLNSINPTVSTSERGLGRVKISLGAVKTELYVVAMKSGFHRFH